MSDKFVAVSSVFLTGMAFLAFWFGVIELGEAVVVLLTLLTGLASYIPIAFDHMNREADA